ALWYALDRSGIHATVAGVVLGFMIPARAPRAPRAVIGELAAHVVALHAEPADAELDRTEILMMEEKLEAMESPLDRFVHLWHPFVAFAVMPLFALANA